MMSLNYILKIAKMIKLMFYIQSVPPKFIHTLNNYLFQWVKSEKKHQLSFQKKVCIHFGRTPYILP